MVGGLSYLTTRQSTLCPQESFAPSSDYRSEDRGIVVVAAACCPEFSSRIALMYSAGNCKVSIGALRPMNRAISPTQALQLYNTACQSGEFFCRSLM